MIAPEMALSIINDPLRTDPLAAIVSQRLNDARRLMRKSKARLEKSVAAFQATSEDPGTIHAPTQGPIAGLKQAAYLLGGSLKADDEGFLITFSHGAPDLHINKGKPSPWQNAVRKLSLRPSRCS